MDLQQQFEEETGRECYGFATDYVRWLEKRVRCLESAAPENSAFLNKSVELIGTIRTV